MRPAFFIHRHRGLAPKGRHYPAQGVNPGLIMHIILYHSPVRATLCYIVQYNITPTAFKCLAVCLQSYTQG